MVERGHPVLITLIDGIARVYGLRNVQGMQRPKCE